MEDKAYDAYRSLVDSNKLPPADLLTGVWEEISCAFAPENLACDGEISDAEINERYNTLVEAAHTLRVNGMFCPSEIAELSDGLFLRYCTDKKVQEMGGQNIFEVEELDLMKQQSFFYESLHKGYPDGDIQVTDLIKRDFEVLEWVEDYEGDIDDELRDLNSGLTVVRIGGFPRVVAMQNSDMQDLIHAQVLAEGGYKE